MCIQYGRSQTFSTKTHFRFTENKDQLSQLWNGKGFSLLDQALVMCEMVEQFTSRSAQVAFMAAIKPKMTEKTARKVMRTK